MKKFVICCFVFVVGCSQETEYEKRFKYLQCSVSHNLINAADWHPADAGDYLISLQLEVYGDDLMGMGGENTSTFFREYSSKVWFDMLSKDIEKRSVSVREFFLKIQTANGLYATDIRTLYISRENLNIYDHSHEDYRKRLGRCFVRSQEEFDSEMNRLTDEHQKLIAPLEEKEEQRRKDRVI